MMRFNHSPDGPRINCDIINNDNGFSVIKNTLGGKVMSNKTKTETQALWMTDKMKKMINLFKSKNIAYDDSFGKTFRKYGAISSLTRISDKFNRIEALILGAANSVTDERLEDTLEDMANYCMMLSYELKAAAERDKVDKEYGINNPSQK